MEVLPMEKLPSGSFRICKRMQLIDGNRRKFSATGKTEHEAALNLQDKINYANNRIRFGDALDRGDVRLFDAITDKLDSDKTTILDGKERPKRDSSIARDRNSYKNQIEPFAALNKPIKDLMPTDIAKWYDWINAQKKANGHPLAADSKNRALSLLKSVIDTYCARTMQVSPMAGYHYWHRKKRTDLTQSALTQTECKKLIAYCHEHPSKNEDIILLILAIYCRPGEALALKVKDYDPDEHTLYINRTVINHSQLSEDGRTKTPDSLRHITLPQAAQDIIIKYCDGKKPDDLLFQNTSHGCMDECDFNHHFKRVLKKCGIKKDLHAHNLRTTGISIAQFLGADVKGVSKNAGHSSIETTQQIYTAIYQECKQQAVNVMDNFLADNF